MSELPNSQSAENADSEKIGRINDLSGMLSEVVMDRDLIGLILFPLLALPELVQRAEEKLEQLKIRN